MGVLEQNNRRKGLLLGQDGNTLIILIAITAIVFAIINFIKIGYYLGNFDVTDFYKNVLNWFLLPADASKLLARPWTLLSYMFTHETVWHMISNMLWLWSFGFILQQLTGNRHLAPIYLYGGLWGSVFFILAVNLVPGLRNSMATIPALQGAGPALLSVAVATTMMSPGYKIFPFLNGGIPLWVLTLIFAVIDYMFISRQGTGVLVAHLAGGLSGAFYVQRLRSGRDWGLWMHHLYEWFFSLFDPAKRKLTRSEIRKELFYQQGSQAPFKKTPIVTQQKIDEILDKINQHGFHYLSEDEKEYLRNASKQEL
ncbi:rhomboid family intramembrane serine protease [soil metagenome]